MRKIYYYWMLVVIAFSLVGFTIYAQPQLTIVERSKKNEVITFEAIVTGAKHLELYIEYNNQCCTIDFDENDLTNQTASLVTSYEVIEYEETEDYVHVKIICTVDKAIQRSIDRITLVCYSKVIGVYTYELF